jgi:acetylornithine deacetylase/succinyl-diaminopimelate desuccinylase-like protein
MGEGEPFGTPHVLAELKQRLDYAPDLLIAGERTGERGDEQIGQICTQNWGLMRMEFQLKGSRGHTGLPAAHPDLSQQLLKIQTELTEIMGSYLTLNGEDGWRSQARFPYIQTGEPGIFNVTAEAASLGLEVRPIPEDELDELIAAITDYCAANQIERKIIAAEPGVTCDGNNLYLVDLIASIEQATGTKPEIGRKLPGTSARFAPGGQGVVWGQSGIGPHSADERHYIPSIKPYYAALNAYADRLSRHQPSIQ